MADTTDTTDTSDTSMAIRAAGASPIFIDDATFHDDVAYLESLWRRVPVGAIDLPIIDIGEGAPIVFAPILENLEFVYARQVRALSQSHRVILYRRREERQHFVGVEERVEELRGVLDTLGLQQADLVAHGDAAMLLLEFAARYPQRCRSLVIIAQAADYEIAPHPLIWLVHEISLHLPIERVFPAWLLRRMVINYIMAYRPGEQEKLNRPVAQLPRHLIEEQFSKIARWPFVYKYSVLPIVHSFDIRDRLQALSMPVLLINRPDDVLSPEAKTRWLAEHLPNCAGYHLVPGRERFFMYSQAEEVNRLITEFYESR